MDAQCAPLNLQAIRAGTRGRLGSDLLYFRETDSTSAELLRLSARGLAHGTLAVTDYQTAGRGRNNRVWLAPPCTSLLFSVALAWPDNLPPAQSMMLAALAVADGIRAETGLETELKWPNDVLVGGLKLCGILGDSTGRSQLVIGIGLNVNFDPSQLQAIPPGATSVQQSLGRPVPREPLLLAVVDALEMWYGVLTGNRGMVFQAWASRLDLKGRRVSIQDSTGDWDGIVSDVGPDGGLRVRVDGENERLVYAADVSLRPVLETLQQRSRPLQ